MPLPRHSLDMQRRLLPGSLVAAAVLLSAAGCGSGPGSPAGTPPAIVGSIAPGLPDGEVTAQGTVLDTGDGAQLCLGAIAESYPPQCSGIPLREWSWEGVDGAESASGVTWGAYAVQGVYDGETFAVTQPPVMLALYDPMVPDDPTNGEPGPAGDAELLEVQARRHEELGADALESFPRDGRLWVRVVWDDGTLQDAADGAYGDGVVVIRSALHEVG